MGREGNKIAEAREHLIKATKILNEVLEGGVGAANIERPLEDWMEDRVELWCRLYNEGGIVTKQRLHELWCNQMGKDARGLGGFFAGKGASLAYTTDDKIILTKYASDSILAWTGVQITEYAKRFKV